MTTGRSGLPDILIWGAGSQSRILAHMINRIKLGRIIAVVDEFIDKPYAECTAPHYKTYEGLKQAVSAATHFVVAIGNHHGQARMHIHNGLVSAGLLPLSICHPSAIIDNTVVLGAGCVVMPGVTVNPFSIVGDQAILNTGCTIDHEAKIGNGVHIMGSAALAGRVTLDEYATIGTNATLLPDVRVGQSAYVGGGSVVTRNVPAEQVVAGVPAKILRPSSVYVPKGLITALEANQRKAKS